MRITTKRHATRLFTLLTFCFAFAVVADGQSAENDIESLQIVQLPAPEFNRHTARPKFPPFSPRLSIASTKRNQIIDEEAWFTANNLKLPLYNVTAESSDRFQQLPPTVPARYKDTPLVKAIRQAKTITLIYGKDFSSGRYLIAMEPESGKFRYGFDFINYAYAPDNEVKDRDFVYQNIEWAVEEGNTLYISHNHMTYARSSKGMNAYITAIDTQSGRVVWRSQPLVSNANNFELIGNLIVCGYGFTAEPDYLYLLDKKTGDVKQQLAVKSKADYIIHKYNKIYVRMYDTDLVVDLK